jgi:thymidine phosphorylase
VPSIPLIVASILSKKLAESIHALVLDVKFGTAAFMQTKEQARKLARAMVALGNECGVNTRALLTNMDVPLGRAAGNWLEVMESVAILDNPPPVKDHPTPSDGRWAGGEGGNQAGDLRFLVLTCAAHLLVQTGKARSLPAAHRQAGDCLISGAPRRKWDEMLVAQGADLEAFNRKLALDHPAPVVVELKAKRAGFVSRCDARLIGEVIRDLGGGRLTKDSLIDYDAGVDQLARIGERVRRGATLARVHAANAGLAEAARKRLSCAFAVAPARPQVPLLIHEVLK